MRLSSDTPDSARENVVAYSIRASGTRRAPALGPPTPPTEGSEGLGGGLRGLRGLRGGRFGTRLRGAVRRRAAEREKKHSDADLYRNRARRPMIWLKARR